MNWRRMQKVVLGAGALGLSACGGGSNPNPHPEPQPVQEKAGLLAFQGSGACQDLETYLEDTAVLQMRTQLEAMRDEVPSWGWWGGWGGRFGGPEGDLATAGAAAPSNSASKAPSAYTTTNTQVAGVDEADFVKNDGTRIFALSGNKLYATKSWPAAETALQGKLEIEGWPREMFLDGTDKAVVFSSVWERYPLQPSLGVRCSSVSCGYYYSNSVKVTVVDVSDLSNLKVSQEYYLPGAYTSSRKVGASVRMVMNDEFRFPPEMRWWPETTVNIWDDAHKAERVALFNDLIAKNEQLIRAQQLSDWLPPARARLASGQVVTMPQSCDSFSRVNAPTRLGEVSVVTLDLKNPGSLDRTSILAESGEVYASTKNLYVGTKHWWWWPQPGQKDTTYIHKFDISDPTAAKYVASGKVDGHIVDQFSMDENAAGYFRVASTITTRVPDEKNPGNWWGTTETTNRISVLGETQGRLAVVGQSEDIAKGESIMSSRFLEDTGYVVTFRQVDPFFTFDLKDPSNPRKVGELKVPGFSSYIHPLDATHLLTIGTYIPENNPSWQGRRIQLAIYDVGDLANPKQTFTQEVGDSYSYSEAQWDHKAFNFFGAKKLLAIPFADWNWGGGSEDTYWSSFTSDLRVFEVDALKGFVAKGALSLTDLYITYHYRYWTYYWMPNVRRSVMADDFVYAISDAGLRVANIADLSKPLATVSFDRYYDEYY